MTRAETKGERKRTTTTNRIPVLDQLNLVEEVTAQILSFGSKPFVNFTDAYF